jgi:hypothetical protein
MDASKLLNSATAAADGTYVLYAPRANRAVLMVAKNNRVAMVAVVDESSYYGWAVTRVTGSEAELVASTVFCQPSGQPSGVDLAKVDVFKF